MIQQIKDELNELQSYIYFDERQFLREQTNHPEQCWAFIHKVEPLLEKEWSKEDLYFLYSSLGYVNRVLNRSGEAITFFEKALRLQLNHNQEIVTLIRLSEAFKYANEHQKSLQLLREAMNQSSVNNILYYEDFILQHRGKCLMELGELNAALEDFSQSLAIRKSQGNKALICSTQKAFDFCLKCLKERQGTKEDFC